MCCCSRQSGRVAGRVATPSRVARPSGSATGVVGSAPSSPFRAGRADGTERQRETGKHTSRTYRWARPAGAGEEGGCHCGCDQCHAGGAGGEAVHSFGCGGRAHGVRRVETDTTMPQPAAMIASGTTRDHPFIVPAKPIPSPSTTIPVPQVKNEAVMTEPYEPLAYSLRRSRTGLRSDRTKWSSTKPATLDNRKPMETSRNRALSAAPLRARSPRCSDHDQLAGTDAGRRSGCAARTAGAMPRR